MGKIYVALCALLLQATWIQAAPAESTLIAKAREPLGLVDRHIIGGDYVDIATVPHQLSFQSLYFHFCGAAIISADYALTAGHCHTDVNLVTRFTTWLTAGSTTVFPFVLGAGTKHSLDQTWRHPRFNLYTIDYDISVIRVRNPFQFGNTIKAVPLPLIGSDESDLDFTQNATISGWGVTGDLQPFSSSWLKRGSIPLVSRTQCSRLYQSVNQVTPRMICAGGLGRGDSCQGDSGGPITHQGILMGVVSWGKGCNMLDYPGVYTNLYDEEIRAFVNEHSGL